MSSTIIVANMVQGTNVNYNVTGPASGDQSFGSGNLGSPTSGTYEASVQVSGYPYYNVIFSPVGVPQNTGAVIEREVVVEDEGSTQVSLALQVE